MYSDLVGMLQQDYFKEYRNYMDLLGVMSPVSRTAAAGGGSTAALDQQLVASRLHAALSRQKSSPLAIETLSQHHRRLDRSHSEPLQQQQPQQQQPQQQQQHCSSRYKTELCRPYEESGHCRYGEKCQFAHGLHELRVLSRHPKYKTDLCRTFHTSGYCPYGARCHFVHNSAERRAMLLGLSPPDYSSAAGADVATLLLANSPDEGLFHFPTSPSPVGSLASELETLSLGSAGSASGSPPPLSPAPPTTSLPVFSRLRQAL